MGLCPVVAVKALVVTEQQLGKAVARAHQVPADVLAGADQVPAGLLVHRGNPDRRELAGHQQPDQQLGVAAIGLDPVGRRAGDLARCCDQAADAGGLERPRQPEPGRAGLIADPDRRRQRRAELHDLRRPTRQPLDLQLSGLASAIAATTFAAWTSSPTQVLT